MWRLRTFLCQAVKEGIECVPLSAAARSVVRPAEVAVGQDSSSVMAKESAAAVQGFTERHPYM